MYKIEESVDKNHQIFFVLILWNSELIFDSEESPL